MSRGAGRRPPSLGLAIDIRHMWSMQAAAPEAGLHPSHPAKEGRFTRLVASCFTYRRQGPPRSWSAASSAAASAPGSSWTAPPPLPSFPPPPPMPQQQQQHRQQQPQPHWHRQQQRDVATVAALVGSSGRKISRSSSMRTAAAASASTLAGEAWEQAYGQPVLRHGVSLEQGLRESMEDAAQVVPHGRCGFFFASEFTTAPSPPSAPLSQVPRNGARRRRVRNWRCACAKDKSAVQSRAGAPE